MSLTESQRESAGKRIPTPQGIKASSDRRRVRSLACSGSGIGPSARQPCQNTPGGIRTHDLRFRKPALYPSELREQARCRGATSGLSQTPAEKQFIPPTRPAKARCSEPQPESDVPSFRRPSRSGGGAGSMSARRNRDPARKHPRKQKTPATPLRRHSAPFNVLACGSETCASPVLLAVPRPLTASARQLAVCRHGRTSWRSRFRLHGVAFNKVAFIGREQYRSELVEFPQARHNKGGAAGRRGRPTKGNSSGLGRGDSWQAKRSTTVVARSVTGWD